MCVFVYLLKHLQNLLLRMYSFVKKLFFIQMQNVLLYIYTELGRLLTNVKNQSDSSLTTKNVVSNVIITLHILGNIIRLLFDYF